MDGPEIGTGGAAGTPRHAAVLRSRPPLPCGWAWLATALLAGVAQADPDRCAVRLLVEPVEPEIVIAPAGVVDGHQFKLTLLNAGPEPVSLVVPGDGSAEDWRTPSLHRIRNDGQPDVPSADAMRCGNINPLQPGEVFTLEPGASRVIADWIPPLSISAPGHYSVRLRYQNEPKRAWRGIPLGRYDGPTMRAVTTSTPCEVTSDPLEFDANASPAGSPDAQPLPAP